MARLSFTDRDLLAELAPELTPAGRAKALADFARESLSEVQAINAEALGSEPPFETVVDGRKGAALESVSPDGVIVFQFEIINDLLAWVGEELIRHSPVLTGTYRDSHLFFADGVEYDPGAALPPAQEYLFLSPLPYAGKIERGQGDAGPDGVYQAVAALAARRFGKLARIKFTYRSLVGGSSSKPGRNERRPAIVITV